MAYGYPMEVKSGYLCSLVRRKESMDGAMTRKIELLLYRHAKPLYWWYIDVCMDWAKLHVMQYGR